jgi:hypothetical protein
LACHQTKQSEDSIMTIDSRSLTAAIGVLLLGVLANTAMAGHGRGRPTHGCGRTCGVVHAPSGYGWSVSRSRHGARSFDRGYAAGRAAGWRAGYHAGRYGRRYDANPHGRFGGHAQQFRRGFARGFADGYAHGYRQGRWACGSRIHRRF